MSVASWSGDVGKKMQQTRRKDAQKNKTINIGVNGAKEQDAG